MSKIIAANWKMNLSLNEAEKLASEVVKGNSGSNDIILFPPYVYLWTVKEIIKGSRISLGAQNCHFENSGAFTGNVSASMLKGIGCGYVIVGHSECRQHHNESDELINKKAKSAITNGLIPLICIGEKLEEREQGKHKEIVSEQIRITLADIDVSKIILAYEPVWAIGTGKTATSAEISEMHEFISSLVKKVPLLYGGSVNEKNYHEILDIPNVDGLLIGGASLQIEKFSKIISY